MAKTKTKRKQKSNPLFALLKKGMKVVVGYGPSGAGDEDRGTVVYKNGVSVQVKSDSGGGKLAFGRNVKTKDGQAEILSVVNDDEGGSELVLTLDDDNAPAKNGRPFDDEKTWNLYSLYLIEEFSGLTISRGEFPMTLTQVLTALGVTLEQVEKYIAAH